MYNYLNPWLYWKKTRNLKVEMYVLFDRHSEGFKPSRQESQVTLRGGFKEARGEPGYIRVFATKVMKSEYPISSVSVQSLSRVWLSVTPWTTARQAFLSITNSQSSPKPMSIESVMPSNHLILCRPLLLLPSNFPSIRVFSNESALLIRWPKYWSFSFNISPSNEDPGLISFRMDWLDLLAVHGLSRVFSNTTVQKHQFFSAQLSSQSKSHIHTWPLEKP